MSPLPSDETTPPVMNIYRAMGSRSPSVCWGRATSAPCTRGRSIYAGNRRISARAGLPNCPAGVPRSLSCGGRGIGEGRARHRSAPPPGQRRQAPPFGRARCRCARRAAVCRRQHRQRDRHHARMPPASTPVARVRKSAAPRADIRPDGLPPIPSPPPSDFCNEDHRHQRGRDDGNGRRGGRRTWARGVSERVAAGAAKART